MRIADVKSTDSLGGHMAESSELGRVREDSPARSRAA